GWPEAEARSARCPADFTVADGEPFSPYLDSHGGRAGSATVADSSPAPGTDAGADQEPTAAYRSEPGSTETQEAVDRERDGVTEEAGAGTVGTAASGYVAGDAGATGSTHSASGASRATSCGQQSAEPAAADPSRSGPGDLAGHHSDYGRSESV